ncbi:MAG: GntR family transcriptional regulator [Lentisphaerae bacterium]|nr:GntR family transcriptional regulator [Lentisphaerota bacterium]
MTSKKRQKIVEALETTRTALLDLVRSQIVSGKFPPGSRLPTRATLVKRYKTTPVTVQRVFDTLATEGFIVARGRAGTFVAEQPPHLANYVLFFPTSSVSGSMPTSYLWQAMISEGKKLAKKRGRDLSIFDWSDAAKDVGKNLQFIDDLLDHRVAGLIFPTHPAFFTGLPVMHVSDVPRVALIEKSIDDQILAVCLEGRFTEKALDRFKKAGRSRVAVLGTPGLMTRVSFAEELTREAAKRGMTCPEIWQQSMDIDGRAGAKNLTKLMFSGQGGSRPDAFMIMDDNLVGDAGRGLAETGLRVPEDVLVIEHCNFPCPPDSAVPAVRLGYDIGKVMRVCMDLIDAQRRGDPVAADTLIEPVFEDEPR